MSDLFDREQRIFENASLYSKEIQEGAVCDPEIYGALVKEYGRLLKQIRRITKISDRTTVNLNTSKQDLMDKVHYDAMTGIYNRRFMEENLKRLIKSVSRSGGIMGVLMMDVDFFKRYNDTYGHSVGDECLKTVAGAIRDCLHREEDFVARYGGEEFLVVLPYTDESGVRVMAGKILEQIRACRIPHENNDAADCVTISIGAIAVATRHSHSSNDYIKRADEALYMSKQSGRNRYTFLDYIEA